MEHQQELTGKHYSLNSRLKLFDAVITPTVLYGSECWTTTKHLEDILRTTQRKMLRIILGRGRRRIEPQTHDDETSGEDVQSSAAEEEMPEAQESVDEQEMEPFVDWIRRVIHEAESRLEGLKIKTWVEAARTRKWHWAAKVLCSQGDNRWSRIACEWDRRVHRDIGRRTARRKAAEPRKRWLDDITKIFDMSISRQKQYRDDLEQRFIRHEAQ